MSIFEECDSALAHFCEELSIELAHVARGEQAPRVCCTGSLRSDGACARLQLSLHGTQTKSVLRCTAGHSRDTGRVGRLSKGRVTQLQSRTDDRSDASELQAAARKKSLEISN